jgi:hypothetical protein
MSRNAYGSCGRSHKYWDALAWFIPFGIYLSLLALFIAWWARLPQ